MDRHHPPSRGDNLCTHLFSDLCFIERRTPCAVYRSIDRRADDTHSTAIPLTYLSGAARRADTENGLDIVIQPDGVHALRAREQGKTWLYLCRDGYLYKQIEGKPAETAERLCKAGSLRLRRVNGVIRADYTAPNGSRSTLLLGLRAAGGAS